MSNAKSLLVELLVEELPPKSLKRLGEAFADEFAGLLKANGFAPKAAKVTAFASPRRLAALVADVVAESPTREHVERLLPVSVAFGADGNPTPAYRKRLEKIGLAAFTNSRLPCEEGPDKVYIESDGKADQVYYRTLVAGRSLGLGVLTALESAIDALPIAKIMSYQLADGWESVKFVRPAHGLVALHGADPVSVRLQRLGLTAGRTTRGHRFEAKVASIDLRDADSYAEQLEIDGAVIASFAKRRAEVVRQLQHAAKQEGLTPIDDEALLDEVTALVERPNVLLCRFEPEFLAVPPECLILTMKANQKYFPLLDASGKLTEKFLVVSNIRPNDASAVIQGNERVVRPRLADAKFFFDQDRKKSLESRLPLLDKVVYHGKLGTQGERVGRVRAIARAIGEQLGGAALAAQADRAAQLAKADLVSDMVGEFPELQGVMGGYYARHDGESEAVAFAVEDHYKPRFAGDALPRNEVGIVVALADKLETLVGLFGVGDRPSGDKDPFALRRHALGVIRMLVERELPLDLDALFALALPPFGARIADPRMALTDFSYERLAGSLRDQGYSAHEVDAVLSLRPMRLAEVPKRLAAVRAFTALTEAASLAAANKRIANILKKSDAAPATGVDAARLVEPAERALAGALRTVQPIADSLFDNGEYAANLRELAVLKAPVDAFFDSVMVNADDAALRANRLALLATLHAAMNRVADLSKLAT